MHLASKHKLLEFQQFITAVIVLIFACDLDPQYTSDSLNELFTKWADSMSPVSVNKGPALEKINKTQAKSPRVSHRSEYYKTNHFNLTTLKLKIGTFQPANQTLALTSETGSIRITQFDEL